MAGIISPQKTQRCLSSFSNILGVHGASEYSFKTDLSLGICNSTLEIGEEQQNLPSESTPPGEDTRKVCPVFSPFQPLPHDVRFSDYVQQLWDTEMLTQPDSQDVMQLPSPESTSTFSNRFMYPSMAVQMSPASSEMTARSNSPDGSALLSPVQMDMHNFDNFQLPGDVPLHERAPNNTSLSMAGLYNVYSTPGNDGFMSLPTSNIQPSTDSFSYDLNGTADGSIWKNRQVLDSPVSSPVLEEWNVPQAMNSNLYSPNFEVMPPSGSRSSKSVSDMAISSACQFTGGVEVSDESLRLGRSGTEIDNMAREHPLYHNASPQADGLYHCPWENDPNSSCQHKPEKLKCNYDKFVDSHLKPYRCKVLVCKDLQFSSTACLLRHEREAHAMHGHGDKPYLCTYEGCERSFVGNGFPRHWNLRDHMKRVHNDSGQPKSTVSRTSPPPSVSTKGRKRKATNDSQTSRKTSNHPLISKPREPSLTERYLEKYQLFLTIVNQLQDAKNAQNMTLLREAMDCLKVMMQTSERINSAPLPVKQVG